jgi:hypothetical protein
VSDHPLDPDRIQELVSTIFAEDLHAKRVASLANAAAGVLEGAALGIHAIGRALALAAGLKSKHTIKQVDSARKVASKRRRKPASMSLLARGGLPSDTAPPPAASRSRRSSPASCRH